MVEIGQAQIARDRERIGFVDAKAEREGEGEPSGEKSYEDSRREPVSGVIGKNLIGHPCAHVAQVDQLSVIGVVRPGDTAHCIAERGERGRGP